MTKEVDSGKTFLCVSHVLPVEGAIFTEKSSLANTLLYNSSIIHLCTLLKSDHGIKPVLFHCMKVSLVSFKNKPVFITLK